jgi:hypothetical protein
MKYGKGNRENHSKLADDCLVRKGEVVGSIGVEEARCGFGEEFLYYFDLRLRTCSQTDRLTRGKADRGEASNKIEGRQKYRVSGEVDFLFPPFLFPP